MTVTINSTNASQSSLQVNGVDSLVFGGSGLIKGVSVPAVRQTVQLGATNSSGYASMLSAGTGLAINLSATAVPMRTNFAAGLRDYVSTLTADVSNVVTLPASVTSFISQDFASQNSVTWGSTLAQPQYGYSYIQNQQALLQFGTGSGSTTFLDDFGNTWTAVSGAKVQTNQFKFGTGALGGAGTNNVLNGTSDYLKSTSFTSLGQGGWSLRCWWYAVAVLSSGMIASSSTTTVVPTVITSGQLAVNVNRNW